MCQLPQDRSVLDGDHGVARSGDLEADPAVGQRYARYQTGCALPDDCGARARDGRGRIEPLGRGAVAAHGRVETVIAGGGDEVAVRGARLAQVDDLLLAGLLRHLQFTADGAFARRSSHGHRGGRHRCQRLVLYGRYREFACRGRDLAPLLIGNGAPCLHVSRDGDFDISALRRKCDRGIGRQCQFGIGKLFGSVVVGASHQTYAQRAYPQQYKFLHTLLIFELDTMFPLRFVIGQTVESFLLHDRMGSRPN